MVPLKNTDKIPWIRFTVIDWDLCSPATILPYTIPLQERGQIFMMEILKTKSWWIFVWFMCIKIQARNSERFFGSSILISFLQNILYILNLWSTCMHVFGNNNAFPLCRRQVKKEVRVLFSRKYSLKHNVGSLIIAYPDRKCLSGMWK
jgi:hypothetical protein